MSQIIGADGLAFPGMGTVRDSAEVNFQWNAGRFTVFGTSDVISSAASDAGNTPTSTLRAGLLLGKITSSGKLLQYSPTATDGTQIVYGICPWPVVLVDADNNAQDKALAVCIGGYVKGGSLYNLDLQARSQMRGRFFFDDAGGLNGGHLYFPWKTQISKTGTTYQVTAADNGTLFDNTGAGGNIAYTLPAIANGLCFGFLALAAGTVTVASTEGTNMVTFNNASASSVAFSTSGHIIGGLFRIYSNPGATKWIVESIGQSATLTVA
jgi:Bacteriophage lambda head decoration protein D